MDKNLEILKGWDAPRILALLTKLGPEKAEAFLAGKLALRWEEAVQLLFDRHGRHIPAGLKNDVVDANRDFKLTQPGWVESLEETGRRLIRLQTHLKCGPFISVADFHGQILKLCKQIVANPQLANLAKGVGLPFCLPPMAVKDYGETLENFLNAFSQAYTAEFPRQSFTNYRQGNLKGLVKVVKDTRHEEFLAKLARDTVVGLYFPTALQGYSIPAAREQMATLPNEVLLAGGLDIVASLIMYPDILARDWQTPGLDMAAVFWGSADSSLYFKANDGFAYFGSRYINASGYYSSGVVLLG